MTLHYVDKIVGKYGYSWAMLVRLEVDASFNRRFQPQDYSIYNIPLKLVIIILNFFAYLEVVNINSYSLKHYLWVNKIEKFLTKFYIALKMNEEAMCC